MEQLLTLLEADNTVYLAAVLLIGVGLSAYVKIATVLAFVRAGFGFNSIPSVFITSVLALSLGLIIMEPVIEEVTTTTSTEERLSTWSTFLEKNTNEADLEKFRAIGGESFPVSASAFLVTQLREAFSTGLMLFLPFLAIELLVALFIAAVGFGGYSAQFLSLPLKLVVFIGVDGWGLITTNLLKSF